MKAIEKLRGPVVVLAGAAGFYWGHGWQQLTAAGLVFAFGFLMSVGDS